jgi:single-stranded-DNA-specific exonuclease
MDVARDVVELFSVKDTTRAREIAARLNQLNGERQEEERRILEDVEKRFQEDPALRESFCIVVDGDGWHRGVIGITASRVVERHGRPTLVVSREGDEAHGSGRSIHAFHLLNALESCSDLFDRYGGHAHAVGFALPAERIPDLRRRLGNYARERLTLADFEPMLDLDARISLAQVTPELLDALRRLEPFGMGNPEPVFAVRSVRLLHPPRIMKEKHIKLKLGCSDNGEQRTGNSSWRHSVTYDALGWRLAERAQKEQLLPGDMLDIAFTVGHNDHPEFGGLELTLCDFVRTVPACRENPDSSAAKAALPE